MFKSNHETADFIFASDGSGSDNFRSIKRKYRFLVLLHCLRFDNTTNRTERIFNDNRLYLKKLF